jgi:ABC-type uncharacterized transport system involved in gliding motility auxiliary subunit
MSASRSHALRAVVATAGLAGAMVTAQLLLAERSWRVDLTPDRRYVLSDHARQILETLTEEVTIRAFLRAEDPRNPEILDLLERFAAASPHVRHHVIDVNRNPALAWRYGVDAFGSIVVECGERRTEFPNPDEQTLVAAIVHVTRPQRRRVYFLTGHGERRIVERERRDGYSYARVALIQEMYDVEEIRLSDEQRVPADAAALVVASPRTRLSASVLRQIDAYVRSGGGLLALLDPGQAPNLVGLLQRYGVVVGSEIVLDEENRLFAGDYLTILVPGRSTVHPVGASLDAPPLMSQVRPVTTVATELTEAAVDVLKSSKTSWRTADPSPLRTGAGEFVAGRDAPGPVPVGTSVLVRGHREVPGRVLVYGDSDFATNFFLEYLGNRDLFLNSVNWLAGEEAMVASRPPAKIPGVQQFFVSASQGRAAFWLGTVVQPAVVLLIGLAVYARRQLTG